MSNIFRIDSDKLQHLIAALQKKGYDTIGPVREDDSIVYEKIKSVDELPVGWIDEQLPGTYRISKTDGQAYFGYTLPAQSWKRFLYPPFTKLFSARKVGKSLELEEKKDTAPRCAFIGVRPCELRAIAIQDKVFASGSYRDNNYMALRKDNFIVAVNCGQAGNNCFCTSMKTGPKADTGFDLSLTEIARENPHYFVVESGSEKGASIIEEIGASKAVIEEITAADDVTRGTSAQIRKSMSIDGLPELLAGSLDHPHWNDVAKRCLTCGNCTMVCPTCFCTTAEDVTDLTGEHAERWLHWASCFEFDFTYTHPAAVRQSGESRYRHWITHKLGTWHDQFGSSGCVGCGRCIAWCPTGIDITEEMNALAAADEHDD